MSFLFPANPADGDIIVQPQPDGSFIKGTYDAANNLWAVGELPEEPGVPGPEGPKGDQGEKGDPGKGLAISGVVGTESELPLASDHIFQFYIVDDVNKVFYSDGFQWFDLGGPIVGPQGTPGTDGTNGTDGFPGAPGKGWTSTTLIDERPTNYQVRFNSDDGLGFVTDNILGPQGETGSLAVATADTIGGIKIGRGLNITPEGVASAGETSVDLETVPLTPEGTVYNYTLSFESYIRSLGTERSESWTGYRGDDIWATGSTTITMPATADEALVYFFSATTCGPASGAGISNGSMFPFRCYLNNRIILSNATYEYGQTNRMNFAATHNLTCVYNSESAANRNSTLPLLKINKIKFIPGSAVTFNFEQEIYRSANVRLSGGLGRLIVIPMRGEDSATTFANFGRFGKINGDHYYTADGQEDFDNIFPPNTPESISNEAAVAIQSQIEDTITFINNELPYVNETTQNQLINLRNQLYATRDQPGTYQDVVSYVIPIIAEVDSIIDYKFRFQV